MMRSMAASMDFFRCRSGSYRSNELGFELRDRLVGKPDLVAFAALKQRHDDLKQPFVGDKAVADGAGLAKIVRGDRIGVADYLHAHNPQSALDQHDLDPSDTDIKARPAH